MIDITLLGTSVLVMKYVQLKYRKRYFLKQKGATSNEISV